MRNTKRNSTKKSTKKQINKGKKIRRTQIKKKGGGCGCNKGGMRGGYGKASFQPFEQTSGQYSYPLNTHNSDPNMPTTMGSGRLSTSVLHGGKRRSVRSKRMRGGNFLLGNTPANLQLSFNTATGGVVGANNLTGYSNPNTGIESQPIGSKYGGNNLPLV
jgi:hypothetical protein